MVKGRLPRESNPLPGDKPGFVANHDTTGEEDYKRTSPLNPLPVTSIGDSNVKDAAVKAELELIKQGIADNKATNDLILDKLNAGVDTQVTGSNVEVNVGIGAKNKVTNEKNRLIPISDLKILTIPTYDGSGQATHPSVLYFARQFKGYHYWMAFTPYLTTVEENPSILVSNDGENWVLPTGAPNPLDGPPTQGYFNDTELVYIHDGQFLRCYYRQQVSPRPKLWYMDSTDGVNWTAPKECTFLDDQFADPLSPSVAKVNPSLWLMWVGSTDNMRVYRSVNGVDWLPYTTCQSNLGDIFAFWHPEVRMLNGEYVCVVAGYERHRMQDGDNSGHQLYYGTSQDGVNWIFDTNAVITINDEMTRRVYRSSLVKVREGFKLFVSGRDWDDNEKIGVVDVVKNNSIEVDYNQVISKKYGEYFRKSGDVLPEIFEDIFNVKHNVTISALEWATSHNSESRIYIEPYGVDYRPSVSPFRTITKTGSFSEGSLRITDIVENGSAIFDVLHNEDGGYKISFKPGIEFNFPNGVRIRMRNTSATATHKSGLLFYAEHDTKNEFIYK